MMIILTMLVLGLLLGFVGAGGAGLMIAILTLLFDVPVHTALGTSLGAMMFIAISGVFSHCREGNVEWRTGLPLGLFGAGGAYAGASLASMTGGTHLALYTGLALCFFSAIMYVRIFHQHSPLLQSRLWNTRPEGTLFWALACGSGLLTGGLSGFFGVGATPLIQLCLLLIFHTTIYRTVGTTMLIIFPIALLGSAGYLAKGHFDVLLLAQVITGQVLGVYVGAKFTKLVPVTILKITMVLLPLSGGLSLMLFSR